MTRATKKLLTSGAAILAVSLASIVNGAQAQYNGNAAYESMFSRDKNVSVLQRARPSYDPTGIRSGSFIVRPRVELMLGYSDNVFALSEQNNVTFGDQSDVFYAFTPSVDVESDWSRHSFNYGAYVQNSGYWDFDDEDIFNAGAYLDGHVDLNRFTSLFGGLSYQNLHESRNVNSTFFIPESPIEYSKLGSFIGTRHEFGRFRYTFRADVDDYDFENARDISTGNIIDQSFRNATETRLSGETAYALTRDTSLFLKAAINERDHDQSSGIGLLGRDSNGFDITTGVDFDLTRLARGRVALGYLEQDYDNFGKVDGASIDTSVDFFPSQLTTISFDANPLSQRCRVV